MGKSIPRTPNLAPVDRGLVRGLGGPRENKKMNYCDCGNICGEKDRIVEPDKIEGDLVWYQCLGCYNREKRGRLSGLANMWDLGG